MCSHCRRTFGAGNSWELTAGSRKIGQEILRMPIGQLTEQHWTQETAADLRRFLIQQIETNSERRLHTAPLLAAAVPAPPPSVPGPQN